MIISSPYFVILKFDFYWKIFYNKNRKLLTFFQYKEDFMEFKIDGYEGLTELEKLFYETNAKAEIVALLINKEIADSDVFDKYWIDYLETFIQYEKAKEKFTKEVVSKYTDSTAIWHIDFENKICHVK